MNESLADRIRRLRPVIESTRFALTEDDVRWDYETGKHRYAMPVGSDIKVAAQRVEP